MSDRYKDLDPTEQRIATLRRDGHLPVDHLGRPLVRLGNGFESQLARATHRIQERRPPRISEAITVPEFKRLYAATATANLYGWVLNTFVTVAWRFGEVRSDEQASGYHGALLDLMRAWFRDRANGGQSDVPCACIWVKEVGPILGLHSHMLVHVPSDLRHMFRRWLIRAVHDLVEAPPFDPYAERTKGRLVHVSPNFGDSTADQWNVFKYMMKGLDREALISPMLDQAHVKYLAHEFAGVRSAPQGKVVGKRTGNTTAIGPKALQQLTSRIPVRPLWPEGALQDEGLLYDDSFLTAGRLGRQLAAIDI